MKQMDAKTNLDEVRGLLLEKKDVLTLCEGKRDLIALRAVGFTNARELDGPLYKVVESIEKGATVQILTDLDSEGKKLYSMLVADLSQRGVKIDNELREALFRTELRQIEGLTRFLERSA